MTDINLQTLTPDTTLPTTGFLFGADSQASGSPSVFTVQSVATTLLGSTTLTGATITADAPVLNLAQTWNAGGVTFTGLKFNATDTASAAGSLLLDIGTGGGTYASKFSVRKDGRIQGNSANPYIQLDNAIGAELSYGTSRIINGGNGYALYSSTTPRIDFTTSGNITTQPDGRFAFFSTPNSFSTADVILTRRAAANLRFGAADAAAPVAQTLSVQSVVAGTTNTAGANLTITGSQGTGTGAGGSIIFQVAPAGSSGTAQNALSTALTIGSDRSLTLTNNITMGTTAQLSAAGGAALASPADSVWQMRNNAGTDFNRLQFGGGTSAFPAIKRSSTTLQARLADDSAFASVQGKLTTETAYTAGAIVVTGYLTLYDSTGTAYRVPCVV